MMKNIPIRFLPFFVIVLAIGVPEFAHAVSSLSSGFSIVPDACNCASGAGWGCVLQVIGNLLDLAIGIGVLASVAALAYAGFLWVTNPTNSENRTQGRGMILNAIVGLIIALAAWLIVNTILTVLTGGGVSSATSSLGGASGNCLPTASDITGGAGVTTGYTPTGSCPTGQSCQASGVCGPTQTTCGSNTCAANQVCDSTGAACVAAQSCTPPGTTGNGNGGFTYDDKIQAQVGDESPALSSLLTCMSGRLPAGVGRISSISDSKITQGQATFASCAANGCSHGANSCHYGGRTCVGQSYAVDFGDGDPQHPANLSALTAAANACGAKWTTNNEEGVQTHLHVSVGSCGCDGH